MLTTLEDVEITAAMFFLPLISPVRRESRRRLFPRAPKPFFFSAALLLTSSLVLVAQSENQPHAPAASTPSTPARETFHEPEPVDKTSVTQHSAKIGGQEIRYTATAGTLVLKEDNGKPKASIFYISYTRDGSTDLAKRPITFSFNGGPGSSSVWLHMGALGPKRVPLSEEGFPVPPPYPISDNQYSALDYTDLVFIDPVTTGFSRPAPGVDAKQFHGLEGDLASVADFIRLYLTRSNRWNSPKFLAGESYGTTRAAGLSDYLLEHDGIYLNGITLISSVLNFQTLDFHPGNDLPYILYLPTYTAAAWYHKKLPADLGDLQKAVAESRRFAANEYTIALMKGDRLPDSERAAVAKQMARLTGLPEKLIEQSRLRIRISLFTKKLLEDDGRTIGRYDSRLKGIDHDPNAGSFEYDPSYASVQGAYTAAFNEYIRTQLKWDTDRPYEILTGKVQPWNYHDFENRYVDVADRLRKAIAQNQSLHVLVANGYYDLATPFFATEYTFDHMQLDPKLRGNISMMYCDAGHMLYTKSACLASLHQHMAAFYAKTLAQ
jgi:carboxypeptidase C (cathepsin A)